MKEIGNWYWFKDEIKWARRKYKKTITRQTRRAKEQLIRDEYKIHRNGS
jgi:hypothetical protein